MRIWLCFAMLLLNGAAGAQERPNVLLIMADDLGADELGCYGHPSHATPRLDALASEGVRFETCWTTPLCTPTRVLIMTGQYPHRTGYYNFLGRVHAPLPESPLYDIGSKTTFADALGDAGYRTVCAGKWQLTGGGQTLVRDCGFQSSRVWMWLHPVPEGASGFGWQSKGVPSRFWHPGILEDGEVLATTADDYGPDLYADHLIAAFRTRGDQPLLAYFPMALTHKPWDPAPDPVRPGEKTEPGLATNVAAMDRVVGRLLDALEETGEARRTVVIFTGDNGTQGAGKATVTRMGARVPLLVRWPGVAAAGRVSRGLTDLSDVFPTLCELAGAPVPEGHELDGESLVTHLRGGADRHRDWILTELGEERMLRDGVHRLTRERRLVDAATGELATGEAALWSQRRFARVCASMPGPLQTPGLRRPKPEKED